MDENTPHIDPQQAILLVMDYQPGILNNFPNTDALLARMAKALATARSHGMQIGYVRVAFTDVDYEAIPKTNANFAAMAASRRLYHEAPEAQIHEAVQPQPNDIIVRKTRTGAFSTTDLNQQLQDRKINTLVLAGVATSGVVLSTVRDASDHDYQIYVLEDASADRDSEVHTVLTQKVFPRQAQVISVDDLPKLLQA